MNITLIEVDLVDSTNSEAKRLALQGASEGTIVFAKGQENGRGQGDHQWFSPYNHNLYASILLRPGHNAADFQSFSPIVAKCVVQGISDLLCQEFGENSQIASNMSVKWPNDVLFSGKKLAGILIESVVSGQNVEQAIVGIGVNVKSDLKDFPSELSQLATSLYVETGQIYEPKEVLQAIIPRFIEFYRDFAK